MTTKGLKTSIAVAALLVTTALAAPAFADSWAGHDTGNGYSHGGNYRDADSGYGNQPSNGGFYDHDRYQGGFAGDPRQRMERIAHWVQAMAQNGELNRWQAHRAFDMLQSIRHEASYCERDGHTSRWEQAQLNNNLDRLASFLRNARSDDRGYDRHYDRDDRGGPDGRDFSY